jgi:hypothetical protein
MCYFNNNDNMHEQFQYFRGDYEAIVNDLDAIAFCIVWCQYHVGTSQVDISA